jgi:citrate/tricarballylate utilization protein
VSAARSDVLFAAHTGPGAFYEVVPWLAMFIPALALAAWGIGALAVGIARFWRDTTGPFAAPLDVRALVSATSDVLLLRQMRGGGPGCTYPDERPTHRRVVLHQLVFYGFLLTFLSTALATVWQEILAVMPPYPLLHPVVISGTLGGVAQVAGCVGLLALKLRSSSVPASVAMRGLDVAFLVALLVLNLTGLALLAGRESAAMGLLLVIHLGSVAGLFIALPYGKFVHVVYRYAALVRNRQEERLEQVRGFGEAE